MRKIFAFFSFPFILSVILTWLWLAAVNQEVGSTPTAPPPPMATRTIPPPTKTHLPPERPTYTPTHIPGKGGVNKTSTPMYTPTYIVTFTSTSTPTLTSTATLTPTLTPTLTSTPFLNLHIVVYLDTNQDNIFESGEGVNDVLLLVNIGAWKEKIILQDGEAWLALPPDLSSGSDVQVQSPYLHWSDMLHVPKPGEILETSLRLDLPQFPVSLP
jgi:hypothetical protein